MDKVNMADGKYLEVLADQIYFGQIKGNVDQYDSDRLKNISKRISPSKSVEEMTGPEFLKSATQTMAEMKEPVRKLDLIESKVEYSCKLLQELVSLSKPFPGKMHFIHDAEVTMGVGFVHGSYESIQELQKKFNKLDAQYSYIKELESKVLASATEIGTQNKIVAELEKNNSILLEANNKLKIKISNIKSLLL